MTSLTTRFLRCTLPVAVIAATGCASEPNGLQVLVPADIEFSWKVAYNDIDDGLAAILPLDVMAFEARTGIPVAGVEVVLSSDVADFVPADRVEPGDPEVGPDGLLGCASCQWDAYRDEFVDLDDAAREVPLVVETDATGLARVYAVVDAVIELPGGGGFEPVTVRVVSGGVEQTLRLEPF